MNKITVYIALGSNYFKRVEYLKLGLKLLQRHSQIQVKKVSQVYFNNPIGLNEDNALEFANAVCLIETNLSPIALLHYCQSIELALGRISRKDNLILSRPLDLDLLIIEEIPVLQIQKINKNNKLQIQIELQIPHPFVFERNFVICPLAEIINKNWSHPISKKNIQTLKEEFLYISKQKLLYPQLRLDL